MLEQLALYLLLLILLSLVLWIWLRFNRSGTRDSGDIILPAAYYQGLNFLLNEEPDKAIEIFVKVLDVNPETVETHMALGNLFRKRGEVERAIRIHQNLIARSNLSKDQRYLALLELGQDYLKSGLLDRAENLFMEVSENRIYAERALLLLLHIFEQERDWEKAIKTANELRRYKKGMEIRIAQYYCEMADGEINNQEYGPAKKYLEHALSSDPSCVRASLLEGDVYKVEGRCELAIKAWKRIEQQDPVFLGEVAGRLAECYHCNGEESDLYEFFSAASERHNTISMMLVLANIIKTKRGVEAAEYFVIDWLRKRPSVHGLYQLIDLNVWKANDKNKKDLLLLKGIIEELKNRQEGYICHHCGFKGKVLHWLCPGCNSWATVKPVAEGQ